VAHCDVQQKKAAEFKAILALIIILSNLDSVAHRNLHDLPSAHFCAWKLYLISTRLLALRPQTPNLFQLIFLPSSKSNMAEGVGVSLSLFIIKSPKFSRFLNGHLPCAISNHMANLDYIALLRISLS
jgi:hypothetical protein